MLKSIALILLPFILVIYSALILIYGDISSLYTNPKLIFTAANYNYPDSLSFVWNFWWYDYALRNVSNPFYTNLLFHPYGTSLLLHTSTPFLSLLFALILFGVSPILKYNISLILIYLLNFICSYFLF